MLVLFDPTKCLGEVIVVLVESVVVRLDSLPVARAEDLPRVVRVLSAAVEVLGSGPASCHVLPVEPEQGLGPLAPHAQGFD